MPRDVPISRLGDARFPTPVGRRWLDSQRKAVFIADDARIYNSAEVVLGQDDKNDLLFEKAGPRARIFFEPERTRAAVVTCGGLCPGLNNVIRSIFLELHFNYQVPEVLGIPYGFRGLDPSTGSRPISLTPKLVSTIHQQGGTFIGSSRGQREVPTMVQSLVDLHIDILFCVGGDGTQRGAHALVEEIARRNLPIAVVGIPKTIDNDILYCDRSFGLVTAVDKAAMVIRDAHTEAIGALRGIGIVKVMGRDAGFIACLATLANQDTNFCLIPEVPFQLEGEHGLLAELRYRMDHRGHAVIVVAEGAGQHLFDDERDDRDASGNRRYHDIAVHLKETLAAHFKRINAPVEIKLIDPSYSIRSAPAGCEDSMLCDKLARHAVHAAMSGRTDVLICHKNGKFMHVPIPMAVERKQQVNIDGDLWTSVLSATGQPAHFC